MDATTELPVGLWAYSRLYRRLIAGTSAVLAAWLAGTRKAERQLDHRRRREKAMRILRWATDKATSDHDDERLLAPSVLVALDNSKPATLQAEDQGSLDAELDAVLSDATAVVEEYLTSRQLRGEVVDDG